MNFEEVIERGKAGLLELTDSLDPVDPFAGACQRARQKLGLPHDYGSLLTRWKAHVLSSDGGLLRYPWFISYERWIETPSFAGAESNWKSWRTAERERAEISPNDLACFLAVPISTTINPDILEEMANAGEQPARAKLDEIDPILRRDFATNVLGRRTWSDTFALWSLPRADLTFQRLRPLAIALAVTYAASARRTDGRVVDRRFPYHEVPLVSASAHLASGLLPLGLETALVADLLSFVARSRRPSGGWGDGTDQEDLLTTFVAADLLITLDPDFDPTETASFFASRQESSGCWKVLGPELPWITGEILGWLASLGRPFSSRFRWPRVSESTRDSKTGIPAFGFFQELSELLSSIPGLARATTELAFLDLAGFKAFNDRFGQDEGDEVIALLAKNVDKILETRAIRDGGDEFLLVGAPGSTGLESRLDRFIEGWPAIFHERFGADAPVVAPRICVVETRGEGLRKGRESLGRYMTQLKSHKPPPGSGGIMFRME